MSQRWAHVRVSQNPDGGHCLFIDGVDMTSKVLAEGFSIKLDDRYGTNKAFVSMVVAADVLDVDLPEAVVEVLRDGEPE